MAFTVKLWGQKQRPWGYEVRVDVTHVETGRVFNEVLIFPNKAAALDAKISGDALQMLKDRIRDQLLAEVEEKSKPPTCPACGSLR